MSGKRIRYGLLVALIALQVATLASVWVWSRWRSEQVLHRHQDELVDSIAASSADRTGAFLRRAEAALDLTADLVASGVVDLTERDAGEEYFLSVLQQQPDLAGMFVGYSDGEFFFVTRREGGFLTKTIDVADARTVTLVERDLDLDIVAERIDPADTYDPTTRSWYTAVTETGASQWTAPYVFFTSQLPGVTVATPLVDAAGRDAGILGIDVTLSRVTEFLELLPVTERGHAFVVGPDDSIVAYPFNADLATPRRDGEGYRLPTPAEIGTEEVGMAYATALASPDLAAREVVEFDFSGETHLVRLQPVPGTSAGWSVAVTAPADDLVGAIRDDRQDIPLITIVVALGVSVLAVPVIFGLTRPVYVLRERATTDALTSLPNRREFFDRAEELVERASRTETPISVAMLDIDRFKQVNDAFGHAIGDEVLRIVADRLRAQLRPQDLVGRYGGEEFGIVMPDTDRATAVEVLNRVLASVGADPIRVGSAAAVRVTMSAGVADGEPNLAPLLEAADTALLRAKVNGRNRVEVPATVADRSAGSSG